jgi:hypothetical protein
MQIKYVIRYYKPSYTSKFTIVYVNHTFITDYIDNHQIIKKFKRQISE